jgi:anti-sigma regulatory factor (Ser/Thr protein kinase)
MTSDRSANGGAPSSRVPSGAGETAATQPVPDRAQDAAMEGLYTALGGLRRGSSALTAENHQLRAQIAQLQPAVSSRRSGDAAIQFGELAEIALPTGSGAPGAARKVLAHCFTGLVSQQILTDAELLVSELVTNSVQHGELDSDDTVLVRILLAAESLRVEVENPGTAGVVAFDRSDRQLRRDGFGLELVIRLAARWGVSRGRSTNVWFEMGRA